MPSTYPRRSVIAGVAAGLVGSLAGCLGDDGPNANCSGYGDHGADTGPILRVSTLTGHEQVSLGIAVSSDAPASDAFTSIVVRDRDGNLVADVPLRDNRNMSSLDPSVKPSFDRGDAALYAVPLGPPPQHGTVTVDVLDDAETPVSSVEYRFNCYDADGDLP